MEADFRYRRALDGSDPDWTPATHGIRQMVAWASTDHGGRQLPLFPAAAPDDGGACSLLGACE